jgi:hypothetical protein
MGERRGAYRCWWGNVEEGDSLGRPRCIWEDNIKIDFKKLVVRVWTGLISFWLGTNGELL